MKLSDQDYKIFKDLQSKVKRKVATPEEEAEFERLSAIKESKQDQAWYDKYKELFNNSAKLAFNYIRGVDSQFINADGSVTYLKQPNVAVVYYLSNPGRNVGMNDPLNIMSRKLWVALHNKYRGLSAYEQADIGIVEYCENNVVEMIAFCERIFGTIRRYKVTDRNFPRTFAKAMFLDIDAWNNGEALMNFKFNLDLQIEKFSQLFLPKGVSYVDRHVAINSIIFDDAKDSGKASHYMYYPLNFWIWDPTIFNSGSSAKSELILNHRSSMNGLTPDDLIDILTLQIDALLQDQDVTRMTSDLVNLLSESNALVVTPINDDYKCEPIYSQEWLEQLHNAEIPFSTNSSFGEWNTTLNITWVNMGLGTAIDSSIVDTTFPLPSVGLYLYQVDNVIKFNLYAQSHSGTFAYYQTPSDPTYRPMVSIMQGQPVSEFKALANDGLIDSWKSDPDAGTVMELTRWKFRITTKRIPSGDREYATHEIDILPDTLTYSMVMFAHSSVDDTVAATEVSVGVDAVSKLSKFDWHPLLYSYTYSTNGWNVTGIPFGDMDNFAILGRNNLDKLHKAALMSLFDNATVLDYVKGK